MSAGTRTGPTPAVGAGPGPDWNDGPSVMALMRSAICWATGSGEADCMAMSLVMSPWTLILPAMKACIPAWGLPSTKMALAVSYSRVTVRSGPSR